MEDKIISYGGQAVIEGVMIRGPRVTSPYFAVVLME